MHVLTSVVSYWMARCWFGIQCQKGICPSGHSRLLLLVTLLGMFVVSVEFNLMYRWDSTISEPDTQWTQQKFHELFPGKDVGKVWRQILSESITQQSVVDTTRLRVPVQDICEAGRCQDLDLRRVCCYPGRISARCSRRLSLMQAQAVAEWEI